MSQLSSTPISREQHVGTAAVQRVGNGGTAIIDSGGVLRVASGGAVEVATGGQVRPAGGSQAAAIADVPTAGSATAAANATAINGILASLRGAGIIASA